MLRRVQVEAAERCSSGSYDEGCNSRVVGEETVRDRDFRCLLQIGAISVAFWSLIGCGGPGQGTSGGSGGGPSGTTLVGNWSFQVNPTGAAPFTYLSGFVNEQAGSGESYTTASLQVQSNSCFADTKVLDLGGYTQGNLTQLSSFPSYSQTVDFDLSTTCTGGLSLCGTYTVSGGCGDGATGQVLGTLYTQLNGTLQTAPSVTPALKLAITQSAEGTGEGTFQVSGTLAFTNASCLTSATIDTAQSYLSGSTLSLVATTNAAGGAQLVLNGTMNPAATSILVNSIALAGSGCLDSLNGVTLN
jgi:hypothetical protein